MTKYNPTVTKQFKGWWAQWVKNHELPEWLSVDDVSFLIGLAETTTDEQLFEWNKHRWMNTKMNAAVNNARYNMRRRFGMTDAQVKAWAKEYLDTLYTVYQHEPPDTNDCKICEGKVV